MSQRGRSRDARRTIVQLIIDYQVRDNQVGDERGWRPETMKRGAIVDDRVRGATRFYKFYLLKDILFNFVEARSAGRSRSRVGSRAAHTRNFHVRESFFFFFFSFFG